MVLLAIWKRTLPVALGSIVLKDWLKKRAKTIFIVLFTVSLTQSQEKEENKFTLVKGDKSLKEE